MSAVIFGEDSEQAQKEFESRCLAPEAEKPVQKEIRRIVAAQFMDQLLTESGGKPLDWREVSRQITEGVLKATTDEFEQGYWVDVNQVLPPGAVQFDVESLKRDVPEEIRSGLNWSVDKTFIFLVSILSPPPPPPDPEAELESQLDAPNLHETDEQSADEAKVELDEMVASSPEMREKEAVVLVEARNSVVAGWLWRKFSADTSLAQNEIYVSPCCPIFSEE